MGALQFKINFEPPFFEDMEPCFKSADELVLLLLRDAGGESVNLRNYNEREINMCARQLILAGFLRGTVKNRADCSWSRTTRKGAYLLKILQNESAVTVIY